MGQTTIDRLENYLVVRATGTGAAQSYTHGKQSTPAFVEVCLEDVTGGTNTFVVNSFDNKTVSVTVTNAAVYTLIAWFYGK